VLSPGGCRECSAVLCGIPSWLEIVLDFSKFTFVKVYHEKRHSPCHPGPLCFMIWLHWNKPLIATQLMSCLDSKETTSKKSWSTQSETSEWITTENTLIFSFFLPFPRNMDMFSFPFSCCVQVIWKKSK
jgi:hypothetical protein